MSVLTLLPSAEEEEADGFSARAWEGNHEISIDEDYCGISEQRLGGARFRAEGS